MSLDTSDLIARGLGATDAELGIFNPAIYRVYIRDSAFRRVAELTDWISLDFVLRFNGVGTWALETSADSVEAQLLTKTSGIIVTRELDGIEATIFSGTVSTEWAWTAKTFRAAGRSDDEILEVPALPTPSGPPYTAEYDVRTGTASTVMISLVQANLWPPFARPDRALSQLTFKADPLVGTTITSRGRFQPVLTMLQELAVTPYAGGLGFKVLGSDTTANSIEFSVYVPVDRSEDAKFSLDLGTAQEYEDVWQAPRGNYFYVLLGDGLGDNRTVIEGGDAGSIAELGRQIERVIDKRGITDTGEGEVALAEALAGAVSLRRSAITPFDVPSLQYGSDYDLGDLVTIVTQGGTVVDLIREIKISLDPERGAAITPIVGKGDGSDEERIADYISSLQNRQSNLERNWNVPPDSIDDTMLRANSVTEAKLDILDAPADNEMLTYDSASGRFEWQGLGPLAAITTFTTITASGAVQGSRLISTVATGTAPLTVTSTTKVNNLNANYLEGHGAGDFALTSDLSSYLPLAGGTVTGAVTMQGTLAVDGNVTLGNAITDQVTVSGDLIVGDDAAIAGDISGDRIVAGSTTFTGSEKLRVAGATRAEGAITVTTGGIGVTGSSIFNSGLTVQNQLTVQTGGLQVDAGGADVTGSSTFHNSVTISSGGIGVTGSSTFASAVAFNGAVTLNSTVNWADGSGAGFAFSSPSSARLNVTIPGVGTFKIPLF